MRQLLGFKSFGSAMGTAALATIFLFGCGGGGGSDETPTELEGTWAFATANHTSGENCGLTTTGVREERVTMTFAGSRATFLTESCVMTAGSTTGKFNRTFFDEARFAAGGVYLTSGGVAYKTLDIMHGGDAGTEYSGYNLSANRLKLAIPNATNDGSTAAKRMNVVNVTGQPTFIKQ